MAKRIKPSQLGGALDETLQRFKDLGRQKAELAVKGAIIHTWGNIIKGTPVDKGGARGAWLIGTSVTSSKGADNKSKGAGYVAESLPSSIFNKRLYLYNNSPYINKLEYGGYGRKGALGLISRFFNRSEKTTVRGFSKLAPKGMVRINLRRWRSTLNRIFKRL